MVTALPVVPLFQKMRWLYRHSVTYRSCLRNDDIGTSSRNFGLHQFLL